MPSAPMLLALSGSVFAGYVAALLGAAMAASGSTFPDAGAAGLALSLVSQIAHLGVGLSASFEGRKAYGEHAAVFALGAAVPALVLVGFALGGGRA